MNARMLQPRPAAPIRTLLALVTTMGLVGRGWSDEDAPTAVSVRLHVQWETEASAAVEGRLHLGAGRIVTQELFAPPPGILSIRQPSTQEILFSTSSPHSWGALQVLAECSLRDEVQLQLQGRSLRTTLAELIQGAVSLQWPGGQLRLSRAPEDAIRVQTPRSHMIFSPNEETSFTFEVSLLAGTLEPQAARFRVGLRREGATETSFPIDERYRIFPNRPDRSRFTLKMKVPTEPGVYELLVHIVPEKHNHLERIVQFVVVPDEEANRPLETDSSLESWLSSAQPLATSQYQDGRWRKSTAWFHGIHRLWERLRGDLMGEPTAGELSASWDLKLRNAQRPHLLELRIEGKPGTLGPAVGIWEALGSWFGPPPSVALWADADSTAAMHTAQAKLLIWPVRDAIQLRVWLPEGAPRVQSAQWQLAELPPVDQLRRMAADRKRSRPALLLIHRPSDWIPFGFWPGGSSSEAVPVTGWEDFLRAADNITAYARAMGFHGVTVLLAGRGIVGWPSQVMTAGRPWDTGRLAGVSADPIPKDLGELMARLCKSRGLDFVPLIRFDGLHPTAPPDSSPPSSEFNPLRSADRERMVALVEELAERYKQHPNFRALAVAISPGAKTCLTDLTAPVSESILAQFYQDSKLSRPEGSEKLPVEEQLAWVLQHYRSAFVAWRCAELQALYHGMWQALRRQVPEAKLLLVLDFEDDSWANKLREASHRGEPLAQSLQERGLDLVRWQIPEGIVVVRGAFHTELSPTALWINRAAEVDAVFGRIPHGTAAQTETALRASYPSPPTSRTGLITVLPDTAQGLPALVRALARGNPSYLLVEPGAPLLLRPDFQAAAVNALAMLPPRPPQAVQTQGPVVVRRWSGTGESLWLVASTASHPVRCRLRFEGEAPRIYGPCFGLEPMNAGGNSGELDLHLNGFSLCLLRSPAETSLTNVAVVLPEPVAHGLKSRFESIMQVVNVVRDQTTSPSANLLLEGQFESPDGRATGWEFHPPDRGRLTTETAHSGRAALQLSPGPQQEAFALSWPFTVPPGTNVAIRLWARSEDRPGKLRIWLVPADRPTRNSTVHELNLPDRWEGFELSPRQLSDEVWSWRLVLQAVETTVYVDDVEVRPMSVTAEEQNAMVKSLAPALRAWSEKRLADFSALTAEYWPQYLLRRFGSSTSAATPSTQAPRPQTRPN